MENGHETMNVRRSYAVKEGLHDGLPAAEAEGHRDEDDLAVFGKRQQLKVCSSSPRPSVLKPNDSENSASSPWSA